ncbi:MAG: NYN domain-containing protein [Paludisphaera borealis]|uniref:NYN domain-containing protein n=1 Tax=Paludisphaera borealis TaxID=1387353 RepID=UPI0028443E92|nr:NYN domain-containing protein [Paludisphaera borealis]MDR3623107.1 NYN domain-containing protein [Paludisphaera borealis]
MHWLIDGYNVMHAAGAVDGKSGRARFRIARRRFLNELADGLGTLVHETTVVFDASRPPGDFPVESVYKGITVIFAVADEDADTRIERIIAHHSNPKALTVVSTDRRVRLAATRRKAQALRADDFLDRITTLAHERPKPTADDKPDAKPPAALMDDAEKAHWLQVFGSIDDEAAAESLDPKPAGVLEQERPRPKTDQPPRRKAVAKPNKAAKQDAEKAHWLKVFGSIDDDPAVRKALNSEPTLLTDAEIAEIQREIDLEP